MTYSVHHRHPEDVGRTLYLSNLYGTSETKGTAYRFIKHGQSYRRLGTGELTVSLIKESDLEQMVQEGRMYRVNP